MTTTHRPVGYARPALLGELAVVFGLVIAYDRIRNLAQSRPVPSATDGARIFDLERLLHLDIERWLNLWLSGHETLAVVASWYYQLLHVSVTMTVLLACYICRPDLYRAARNALVSISVIGLMIFWVFPVAPPRLLPGGGYVDTAVATGAVGLVDSASANPYAAMPSLHLAWAVWSVMFAGFLISRPSLRWLLYAYPVVTTIDVMATANHYLLDAVAGAVLALMAGWLCLMRHAVVSQGREPPDDSDLPRSDTYSSRSDTYFARSDTYSARSDTCSSDPNLDSHGTKNCATKGCDDSTFNTRVAPRRGCGSAQTMEVVSWTLFC
jgi:hypothetical protein